jgi:hypothetical protein
MRSLSLLWGIAAGQVDRQLDNETLPFLLCNTVYTCNVQSHVMHRIMAFRHVPWGSFDGLDENAVDLFLIPTSHIIDLFEKNVDGLIL